MKQQLKVWKFALGDTRACLENGAEVTVPHTWNVENGREEFRGTGWYSCRLEVPAEWSGKSVRVRFSAVYHDAVIYLNGREIGRHEGSGYTPFTVELTGHLDFGGSNELAVEVSNAYSKHMLPYEKSFDWAADGGIIRNVELLVSGRNYIKQVITTAKPIITAVDARQEQGMAVFGARVETGGAEDAGLRVAWKLCREGKDNCKPVCSGETDCAFDGGICIGNTVIPDVDYWHFDRPVLYTLNVRLINGENTEDEIRITIGFRDFHIQGAGFCLNGEKVRLCGTEWMPGSGLEQGMAEPEEHLEKMLARLKESNCIFTRFHWQQDDFVLDWCDRHGMLVQEEAPFWGKDPEEAGEEQLAVFKQQMDEMYAAHCNHPSLIFWGVGNELDAQDPSTNRYIREAVAYAHGLDETRGANYVSNTWFADGMQDGTVNGDVMMLNDYIGTWAGERDEHEELRKFLSCNPGKPMVPAEFGLCEPAFSGGDARREAIYLEKIDAYRQYPQIAGTIYFCLNDYRTHVGEAGEGKHKQRVHGSAGLEGEPKPSYWTLQCESAPFTVSFEGEKVIISCRSDLPCYEMKGYEMERRDSGGQVLGRAPIPDLKPGESVALELEHAQKVSFYRWTGDWAGDFTIG